MKLNQKLTGLTLLASITMYSTASFAGTEMSSISMSPASAISGQAVTGTVRLNETCRNSSGCNVTISSNNRTAAPTPSSALVANGSSSKTFSFVAGSVSARTVVSISASYGGRSRNTGTSFSVSPSGSTGGGGGTAPASCNFNGQTIASGSSVSAFQASSVPSGSSCVSQTRTCNNGVLSGSYQNASCSVQAPALFCYPGNKQMCPIANGFGEQTCNSTGSAFGSCQRIACVYGYIPQGNLCVPDPANGNNQPGQNIHAVRGPWEVTAGSSAELTVILSMTTDRETKILFTSGYPAALTVPASITVPAGTDIVTVPVQTAPSYNSSVISIKASLENGMSFSTSMVIIELTRPSPSAPFEIYTRGDAYDSRASVSSMKQWAYSYWQTGFGIGVHGSNPGRSYESIQSATAKCSAAIPGGVLVPVTAMTHGNDRTPNGMPGYYYQQTFRCQ